jgi:hypothetical protein
MEPPEGGTPNFSEQHSAPIDINRLAIDAAAFV